MEKENLTVSKYLRKYNYKYLVDTNYIKLVDKADKIEIIKDILKFLRVATPEKVYELAHCKTDFNKAQFMSLVSYEDEATETSVDVQAYNWMVDDRYYNSICYNNEYNIKNETEYPKAFIVYRLAKDKRILYSSNEYQTYNSVIK